MLELFLTVVVLMSTFKNKNRLRTIEAQNAQKLKNNEARPKFTSSYKKKKRVRALGIARIEEGLKPLYKN